MNLHPTYHAKVVDRKALEAIHGPQVDLIKLSGGAEDAGDQVDLPLAHGHDLHHCQTHKRTCNVHSHHSPEATLTFRRFLPPLSRRTTRAWPLVLGDGVGHRGG